MAGNALATEYVEFVATGLREVEEGLGSIRDGLEGVEKAYKSYGDAVKELAVKAGALSLLKQQGELTKIIADTEKWKAQIRELEFPLRVAQGIEAMRDAVDGAYVKVQMLRQLLGSGEGVQLTVALQKAQVEAARLQKQLDWDVLVATKGKFGAWASYITGQIQGVAQQAKAAFGQISASMATAAGGSPLSFGAAVAGFQALTGAARGWVNAGLAGTGEAAVMQLQFQLLSREIASVFLPTIQTVSGYIGRLADWFRHLTGAQQDSIRRWIEAAAVMATVATVIPRIAGAITGVLMPGIRALTALVSLASLTIADAVSFATAGLNLLVGAISVGVTALAGLAVGTEGGRQALAQLADTFKPLLDAAKRFFDFWMNTAAPIWDRVGAAAGGAFARIGAAVASVLQRAMPVLQQMGTVISAFVARIAPLFDSTWTTGAALIERFGVAIVDAFGRAMPFLSAFADSLATVWETVNGAFMGIARDLGPVLIDTFSGVLRVGVALANVSGPLMRVSEGVGRLVMSLLRLSPLGMTLSGLFRGLLDGQGAFNGMLEAAADTLEKLATFLAETLPYKMEQFIRQLGDMAQDLARVFSTFGGLGGGQIAGQLNALAAQLQGFEFSAAQAASGRERRKPGDHQSVAAAGGASEGPAEFYRRLQSAALKVSVEQQQLQQAQQQTGLLQQILSALMQTPGGQAAGGAWQLLQQSGLAP
jgi:hypothetical protein